MIRLLLELRVSTLGLELVLRLLVPRARALLLLSKTKLRRLLRWLWVELPLRVGDSLPLWLLLLLRLREGREGWYLRIKGVTAGKYLGTRSFQERIASLGRVESSLLAIRWLTLLGAGKLWRYLWHRRRGEGMQERIVSLLLLTLYTVASSVVRKELLRLLWLGKLEILEGLIQSRVCRCRSLRRLG